MNIDDFKLEDFQIMDYNPHGALKGEVFNAWWF
jgi:thymidylate synthase